MILGMIFFFFFSPERMIFSHHFRQIKGHSYQNCPFNSIIYVQRGEISLLYGGDGKFTF
ncbi:hypothetical protein LCGC14_1179150 [marine sediment metagenome]|uniref:Uncharacterized protein n=1 Tax=marine sediment metagenome TaxID=412755 RepID=A0A0F9LSI8_9ZZZZ